MRPIIIGVEDAIELVDSDSCEDDDDDGVVDLTQDTDDEDNGWGQATAQFTMLEVDDPIPTAPIIQAEEKEQQQDAPAVCSVQRRIRPTARATKRRLTLETSQTVAVEDEQVTSEQAMRRESALQVKDMATVDMMVEDVAMTEQIAEPVVPHQPPSLIDPGPLVPVVETIIGAEQEPESVTSVEPETCVESITSAVVEETIEGGEEGESTSPLLPHEWKRLMSLAYPSQRQRLSQARLRSLSPSDSITVCSDDADDNEDGDITALPADIIVEHLFKTSLASPSPITQVKPVDFGQQDMNKDQEFRNASPADGPAQIERERQSSTSTASPSPYARDSTYEPSLSSPSTSVGSPSPSPDQKKLSKVDDQPSKVDQPLQYEDQPSMVDKDHSLLRARQPGRFRGRPSRGRSNVVLVKRRRFA